MLVFEHARLLDCTGADPRANTALVVEDGRIGRIGPSGSFALPRGAELIDCRGRTLMPGLTDAHVHLSAVDLSLAGRTNEPAPVVALRIAALIEATLQMGYTTVRDAGGLTWGFKEAVRLGLIAGPDLLIAGGVLSQTGGHGDGRGRSDYGVPHNDSQVRAQSYIVDGPDEVRKATREALRRGSDQIKVMANGGAMSPTDEMTSPQFTVEELAAAVYEAKAAGTYVMAHTYTPQSMQNCIEAGVRSLEHGNFLDEETAVRIKESGTFLVPTIVTYEQIAAYGETQNVPENQMRKIRQGLDGAFTALEIAVRHGVTIASGSDLLGPMQPMKAREPLLKANVMGTMAALIATTQTNARLFRLEQEIGTVETGKRADLIVVDGDPTVAIDCLADAANVHVVVKHGNVVKDVQAETALAATG
ncbi:MAG TPA: amidohydrolase family protein [Dehalococcoidia bacterium]|nr:amidohydrolase family protein [Dehalococcoidia bacterium]